MNFIGICGHAGAGKDFMCEMLSEKIDAIRIGLADSLKHEVRDYCLEKYGIDSLHCTREQKEVIRPYLIEYAKSKRKSTYGTYFTSKVDEIIESRNFPKKEYLIIPDIRYGKYLMDECWWLKNKHSGILICVNLQNAAAPNDEELNNFPFLKRHIDFSITWPKFNNQRLEAAPYVDETLNYIYGRFGINK